MKKNETKATECRCPYCDAPIKVEPPFCRPCNVTLEFCPHCGQAIPKGAERCPKCGRGREPK